MNPRLTALAVFIVTAATWAGLAPHDAAAQSVGFHPSTIEIENGLRGQRYEVSTVLINQSEEPRRFELASSGDAGEWVAFADPADSEADTPLTEITAPPKTETPLTVFIDVPDTAPNGPHAGLNTYDGYPEDAGDTPGGLVIGLQQRVEINVTGDQVLDLRAGDVFTSDVEVGQPLRIQAQLNNQGNVDVAPQLQATVHPADDGTGEPIAEIDAPLEQVRAGKSTTSVTEWATEGRTPGEYRADYTISLDGERIAAGEFTFALLPFGSAERAGTIQSLTAVGPFEAGALGRADAVFQNQGAIDSLARFEGQLFRDGVPIPEATSPDSLLVRPDEEVTLSAFFPLPADASGDFEVRGRVYFEGAQTDEAAAGFSVGGDGGLISMGLALGGATALAVGAVTLGGAWALQKKRQGAEARPGSRGRQPQVP